MQDLKQLLMAGAGIALTSVTSAAQYPVQEVVYTSIPFHPTSIIPGLGNHVLDLRNVFLSPNGAHWGISLEMNGFLQLADEDMLIVDGVPVAIEGSMPPYIPAGYILKNPRDHFGILDSGAIAFAARQLGTSDSQAIMVSSDGMGNFVREEMQDAQINGAPAGWTHTQMHSSVITNAGYGYQSKNFAGGPNPGLDSVLMLNGSVLLQTLVDVPAGQMTGLSEPWENFVLDQFFVTPDSSTYLVKGDLTGSTATGEIVVLNGQVVIQEGFPLPGAGPEIVTSIPSVNLHLAANGDWMAAGTYSDFQDWVMFNGAIIARESEAIVPGSTESWTSFFNIATCNNLGDTLIGGYTDGPAATNHVLVLNGTTVVMREGDPVDVDRNGIFDDDYFIDRFENDNSLVSDDGTLYVVARMRRSDGTAWRDCFLIVDLEVGDVGNFCDPSNPNSTGLSTVLSGALGTGVESGLHLEAQQGPPSEFGYFLVGTSHIEPGLPISNGNLCLTGITGRYNVSGSPMNSISSFDASGVLQNLVGTSTVGTGFDVASMVPITGNPLIMSGSTWNFQLWHRDGPGTSNFSNGLSVTF